MGFCRNGTPHDVCIDFPHSPYFKVPLRNKEIETSTVHPPIMPPNGWAWNWYSGNSDDERDIPYFHRGLPGQKRSIGYMRKMKMVQIDDSAYSTFLAVLIWMETGLIFFAPITPEPRPPITPRPLPLQSTMVDPPAVSPKSVFRLAKQLQLEDLAERAMAHLLAQITPQNALLQLYALSSPQHAEIIDNLVNLLPDASPEQCLPRISQRRTAEEEERLHQYSPFFALLENELQDPNRRRPLAASRFPEAWYPVEDDSDDERDDVFRDFGNPQFGHLNESHMPSKFSTIREASWTTCLAVFVWRESGFIPFAPMWHRDVEDDGFPIENTPSVPLRPDLSLPLPVSPKSVFRLAKMLGLDELAALALPIILEQATPLTALYEVYTMASCHNTELRDPLVAMLAEHWDEAKESYWVERVTSKLHSMPPEAQVVTTQLMEALARRGVRYGPNM
ncbi:hypothetical protein JCM10296v2_001068 [Rhodotorula toruloides]